MQVASTALSFQGRFLAEEIRLPGKQNISNVARLPGDLGQLGAIGDQRRFEAQLLGHPIAIGANPIL